MGRSLWDRILGRKHGAPEGELPAALKHDLKEARPVAPELGAAESRRMLASALAASHSARGVPRFFLVGAVMAAAGCIAVGALLLSRRPGATPAALVMVKPPAGNGVAKSGSASRLGSVSLKPRANQQARQAINGRTAGLKTAIPVALPGKSEERSITRFTDMRLHYRAGHYEQRYRGLMARATRLRQARGYRSLSNASIQPQTVVQGVWAQRATQLTVVGEPQTGHLIVAVSEPRQTGLNIEMATSDESHPGFAKAAAYTAIGPGGGVLTQCTLREGGESEDIRTVQYGIVHGRPAARLIPRIQMPLVNPYPVEIGIQP